MARCFELLRSRVGTVSGLDGVTSATRLFFVETDNATQSPILVCAGQVGGQGRSASLRGRKDTDRPATAAYNTSHPWYPGIYVMRHRIVDAMSPTQYHVEADYETPAFTERGSATSHNGYAWTITGNSGSETYELVKDIEGNIIGPPAYKVHEGEELGSHLAYIGGNKVKLDVAVGRVSEPIQAERPTANFTLTRTLGQLASNTLATVWSYSKTINSSDFYVRIVGGNITFRGVGQYKLDSIAFAFVQGESFFGSIPGVLTEITLGITWSAEKWSPVPRLPVFTDDTGGRGIVIAETQTEPTAYEQKTIPEKNFNDLFNALMFA